MRESNNVTFSFKRLLSGSAQAWRISLIFFLTEKCIVKKERFWRMRLLTYFGVISTFCLAAFVFANFLRTSHVEANAIAALRDQGIKVHYCFDYEIEAYEAMEKENEPEPIPPGPNWLKAIFGEMVLARVETVELKGDFKTLDDCREFLGDFAHLKELDISSRALVNVDAIKHLTELEVVRISKCHGLANLDSLGEVKSLQKLGVWECDGLGELSFTDWKTTVLEEVTIEQCNGLNSITGLPKSLRFLGLFECESLQKIQMRNAPELCSVDVSGSDRLASFDVPLESTEEFFLTECDGIRVLDFSQARKLKRLHVGSCNGLVSINLPDRVEELVATDCESLEQIVPQKSLASIRTIVLKQCPRLEKNKGSRSRNGTDAVKTHIKPPEGKRKGTKKGDAA